MNLLLGIQFNFCKIASLKTMNSRSDAQRLKKEKERKEKELEHYGYNEENIEESSHTRSLVRLLVIS